MMNIVLGIKKKMTSTVPSDGNVPVRSYTAFPVDKYNSFKKMDSINYIKTIINFKNVYPGEGITLAYNGLDCPSLPGFIHSESKTERTQEYIIFDVLNKVITKEYYVDKMICVFSLLAKSSDKKYGLEIYQNNDILRIKIHNYTTNKSLNTDVKIEYFNNSLDIESYTMDLYIIDLANSKREICKNCMGKIIPFLLYKM